MSAYQEPTIGITLFEMQDVITTSENDNIGGAIWGE